MLTDMEKANPYLASAVSNIYDYVTDPWSGPYPSKEQTDSVNRYLENCCCGWKDGLTERQQQNLVAHRKINVREIAITLVNFLDKQRLNQAQATLFGIASDPCYHMPLAKGVRR